MLKRPWRNDQCITNAANKRLIPGMNQRRRLSIRTGLSEGPVVHQPYTFGNANKPE
jgi:hypothetical protein